MKDNLLTEFIGSSLFPNRRWVEREDFHSLAEKAYLLSIALRVMLCIPGTADWAEGYLHRTMQSSNFRQWRAGGTDLYVTLWALTNGEYEATHKEPDHVSDLGFLRWMRALKHDPRETAETKRLFLKMDSMLHVTESSMKAMRRLAQDWPHLNHHDHQLLVTRLLQMLRARMPRAECIRHLTKAARTHDLELSDVCNKENGEDCGKGNYPNMSSLSHHKPEKPGSALGFLAGLAGIGVGMMGTRALMKDDVQENASAGATGAASVAAVTKPLGGKDHPGFDSSGHKGIYDTGKPKKSTIIRR